MAIYTDDVDLKALWRFENDLADTAGNNDLTGVNTPQFSSTKKQGDYALYLNNADADYAYIADADTDIEFDSSAWSVGGWFRAGDVANKSAFINKGIATDRGFYLAFRYRDIAIYWASGASSGNGYITTGDVVSADTWYHVVITWDGTTIRCYINGSETSAGDFPATPGYTNRANDENLEIGMSGVPDDEYLDEVFFFTRTLNSTEVSDIYNNGIQDPVAGGRPKKRLLRIGTRQGARLGM